MGKNTFVDRYKQIYWNITHHVDLDPPARFPFIRNFERYLQQKGWKSKPEKIDPTLSSPFENCLVHRFAKPHAQFLTIGMEVDTNGINLSWKQAIDPRLGKILSLVTLFLFAITSISQIYSSIDPFWLLNFFIGGIMINLGVLLVYMFIFDRELSSNQSVAAAFMESVLDTEL